MAWQRPFESQETGSVKSRVLVLHVGDKHGIARYVDESEGFKVNGVVGVLLQCNQESSLPVSSTMVTC